ncbi:MAG: NAD(P)-dependent oxidoreductase [Armatimonadota bacterium]
MAKILITGGAGLIGTNLAKELRGRGHSVQTADIKFSSEPEHFRIDTGEFRQIEEVIQSTKPDFVYHLAAEYGRWNGEDHYENLWRTNVVGTKHVLKLAKEHKFKTIFFSSAEVYGDYDGVMTEDIMEKIPIKQMNDYAISKWAGELQCLNAAEMWGAEVVRTRPVMCYGEHEPYNPYRGVMPIFIYSALTGKPFKCHRGHKRIFDYVTDSCRTWANIVDNFKPGEVYNVGGREEWVVTIEELAQIIIEVTGCDPNLCEVHGEEAFTTRIKTVDFSKARADLKHNPTIDTREGVKLYVEWMKKHYGFN